MTTFTQPSKNSTTFSSSNRSDLATWGDAIETWGDANFNWGQFTLNFTQPSKNITSFSQPTKN
jgi:hypothetical protein